ncbi:YbaN family protein [Bacillus marinisedimentorum]|uniref:YbaN family protein n=1 Tax=Bacillus marinisedimentorum TaxID=1821260 RepID=UPI0007DF47F5|nr:YbaN family protein [Bacillus marinisedimentorum]
MKPPFRFSIKRYLFVFLGSLSLALGVLGIVLPVLPTTPLLLLAAYFYVRSSEKLYNWLINHRIFGPYIYNYIKYRAIKKKAKVSSIIFLWLTLFLSMWLVSKPFVTVILFAVGIGVSLYLLSLKTLETNDGA